MPKSPQWRLYSLHPAQRRMIRFPKYGGRQAADILITSAFSEVASLGRTFAKISTNDVRNTVADEQYTRLFTIAILQWYASYTHFLELASYTRTGTRVYSGVGTRVSCGIITIVKV